MCTASFSSTTNNDIQHRDRHSTEITQTSFSFSYNLYIHFYPFKRKINMAVFISLILIIEIIKFLA